MTKVDLKAVFKLPRKLGQVSLFELIETSIQYEATPLDDDNSAGKEVLRTTSIAGVPQFSFAKGTVKMKDMDTIEFITENKERNLHLLLGRQIEERKAKTRGWS